MSVSVAMRSVGASVAVIGLLISSAPAQASDRGWTYLIEKLVADGMERVRVTSAYRRLPPFGSVTFSPVPGESAAPYRSLLSERSVAAARHCRGRYDEAFRTAEARSGVPASVLSALLHVETHCGGYTGRSIVLHRLSRLAMANEPANVRYNVQRRTQGLSPATAAMMERKVRDRAQYLEDTFYPEVRATFILAEKVNIDPLGLRGSQSGAFGLPQFLPSNYLRFGVDANGNGRVSLYEPDDAIASAANYLEAHGWGPDISTAEKRRVVWAYNRSDAYVDTVLGLSERIEQTHPSAIVRAASER